MTYTKYTLQVRGEGEVARGGGGPNHQLSEPFSKVKCQPGPSSERKSVTSKVASAHAGPRRGCARSDGDKGPFTSSWPETDVSSSARIAAGCEPVTRLRPWKRAARRDVCARWPVMARGGTADPRRLETAAGRRTVAEAAADIPCGSRRRRRAASNRWGARRDGDDAESLGASSRRTAVAAARVAGPSPDLRSLPRVNPLSHPLPRSLPPRARRDVLGRRSSVAYSPGLWPVRRSAPDTISRWSSSARDALAKPRSPSDTSRTSSTTSTSPRYRWLSPRLPLPRRFSVRPIEPTLHCGSLFLFRARPPSHARDLFFFGGELDPHVYFSKGRNRSASICLGDARFC